MCFAISESVEKVVKETEAASALASALYFAIRMQ